MNAGIDDHRGTPGRSDPVLGDLRDLDEPRTPPSDDRLPPIELHPPRRKVQRRPRRRPWRSPWFILGVGALAVAVTLWLGQNWLRDMVPRTALNDVLARADTALQEGRLEGRDGTSARELYQAAQALEPDNDHAHTGLRRVGLAELARADAAYRAGHLAEAQQQLDGARQLLGGGTDVEHLAGLIARARSANTPADDLLARAQKAMVDGRLAGDDGAGALYRRLLTADPGNAVAAHGLDQVGDALAAQAREALARGDDEAATRATDALASLLPSSADLPGLRASLAQIARKHQADLDAALRQGDEALRAGRIAGDGEDTALAHYKAALALDPGNAEAKAGLARVAGALATQADAALDSDDAAQARQLVDQAATIAPDAPELAGVRARLQRVEHPEPPAPPPPPPLSPAQREQVAQLLERARAAASAGRILLPPGEGAYDLYRNALAIDHSNPIAQQGIDQLPLLVISQFNRALAAGDLATAGDRLDALSDLAPDHVGVSVLRQRLGDAWLDRAEQRLAQDDRAGAMQALDQARRIAPLRPRIGALAARLQASR